MGRRGPPKKPTAIKVATGNPGKRQLSDGEPVPPGGEIKPPAWMLKVPRASEIWHELAPVCIAMKTLTIADVAAFARYCSLFAYWLHLNEIILNAGGPGAEYPMRDEKGQIKVIMRRPAAIDWHQTLDKIARLEQQFGLTPAARASINVRAEGPTGPATNPAANARDETLRSFFAGGGPAAPRRKRGVVS